MLHAYLTDQHSCTMIVRAPSEWDNFPGVSHGSLPSCTCERGVRGTRWTVKEIRGKEVGAISTLGFGKCPSK